MHSAYFLLRSQGFDRFVRAVIARYIKGDVDGALAKMRVVPVLCPRSIPWVVQENGFLVSHERGALMGLYHPGALNEMQRCKLIGNAFFAFEVQAMFVALLVVFVPPRS